MRQSERHAGGDGATRFAGGKCCRAALLAATLSLVFGCGIVPRADVRPAGMDDETWTRLQDDVMEFDELADLVECYNPAYRQLADSIEPMVEDGRDTASELNKEIKDIKSEIKELEKKIAEEIPSMDPNSEFYQDNVTLMTLRAYLTIYNPMVKQIRSAANKIDSDSRSGREQMKKSMTNAVQQMFIGYHQALSSKELCDYAVELSQAATASSETQRSIGMATDNDVLSAQQALLSAQNQQTTLENTLTSLRQQLCLMTGWDYDAQTEIGAVPPPDLERIAAMDPSVDVQAAVDASYSLDTLRDSLSSKNGVSSQRRNRTMAEAESNLRTQFEALYQTVMASKASFDAANTALEAAAIDRDTSDRQYQLGMIGRLQYMQAQLMYLQQKMAADNASLSLTQAILNYDWAMDGIIMSSETVQ